MSRSTKLKPVEEPIVLNPLEFAAEKGKIMCLSSADKEPIEELLPVLSGNIVVFTTYKPNISGIQEASKLGPDKSVYAIKCKDLIHATMLCKSPTHNFKDSVDFFILDRFDQFDEHRTKQKKGAARNGMINLLPTYIGDANFIFTTMMGDPGLFEKVDKHISI